MLRTVAVLLLAAALATAESFAVVPDGSTVRFAGASTLHDFAGTAKLLAGGRLRLDGTASAGAIEADATSLDTAHESRDAKMHGETMATATWPRVRFDLLAFEPSATGGTAHGVWTMHGVAREIVIPVTLVRGEQMRAQASFTLDIRQWDVVPPRVLVISVDPGITVTLDLQLAAEPAAAPAPARLRQDLVGVIATDVAGAGIDLGALHRPLVVYTEDGVAEAKAWCEQLATRLPAGRAPLAVLDGRGLADKARRKYLGKGPAGAVLDANGGIAAKLLTPKRDCLVLAIAADGALVGSAEGAVADAGRDRLVALLTAP